MTKHKENKISKFELYGQSGPNTASPEEIGEPGSYPFTRGIHKRMYAARPWTMRQYSGFGSVFETNKRFKLLLEQGADGLSTAFDLPTQMGYDSDHPMSEGEVGKVGVPIDTIEDIERLFLDIDINKVSTSMTINATSHILLAFYIVLAERRGVSLSELRGTTQNDILKEYIARGTYVYPPTAGLKLSLDVIEYSSQNLPKWNPISISGYHIREAGSNLTEELGLTFSNAIEYISQLKNRNLDIDTFLPRFSFFFNCHNGFLEEICKFRAARRVWAKIVRERFGSDNKASQLLRFHTQTAGSSLTAQQPENNIVRTTIQAMSAILGGTQSLHTNSFDEALGLPTEKSAQIALRTQQIILSESGLSESVDPLAGSYLIESLTNEIEKSVFELILDIDNMGGMMKAIEQGIPQKMIEESAYRYQLEVENNSKKIVGVNSFKSEVRQTINTLKSDPMLRQEQIESLKSFKISRNKVEVSTTLESLGIKASSGDNIMPAVIACARAGATLGEISDKLRDQFGKMT